MYYPFTSTRSERGLGVELIDSATHTLFVHVYIYFHESFINKVIAFRYHPLDSSYLATKARLSHVSAIVGVV